LKTPRRKARGFYFAAEAAILMPALRAARVPEWIAYALARDTRRMMTSVRNLLMATPTQRKLASLLILLGAVGGVAVLLAAAANHQAMAAVFGFCAVVWLLTCGAVKLLVDLTEADERVDDPTLPRRTSRRSRE